MFAVFDNIMNSYEDLWYLKTVDYNLYFRYFSTIHFIKTLQLRNTYIAEYVHNFGHFMRVGNVTVDHRNGIFFFDHVLLEERKEMHHFPSPFYSIPLHNSILQY